MGAETPRFLCAPGLRIEHQERLAELQFARLDQALGKIEATMERLEKRLWVTVYGVVAVILATAAQSLLTLTP